MRSNRPDLRRRQGELAAGFNSLAAGFNSLAAGFNSLADVFPFPSNLNYAITTRREIELWAIGPPLLTGCVMPSTPTNLAELLRASIDEAMHDEGESLLSIAQRAQVDYGNLYKFVHHERQQVTLSVAGRLFDALGIVVKQPNRVGKRNPKPPR